MGHFVSINGRPWLFCALLGVALLGGCSEGRQNSTTSKSASKVEGDYQYPHPSGWNTAHVEFVSKHGASVAGSSRDCTSCHTADEEKGPVPKARAMNVSCAMSCHAPSTGRPSTTLPSRPVGEQACAKCHAGHGNRAKSHYPAAAGLCTSCHEASAEHLAGKTTKGTNTRGVDETCYSCHSRVDRRSQVHPVLAFDNSCSNCHDAHGSTQRYFLKKPVEQLCSGCHVVSSDKHKSVHGALKDERACLNCHNPHSSDHKKLMTAATPQALCLSCHDREIQTKLAAEPRTIPNIKEKISEQPYVHGPAKSEDGCLDCHKPHASKYDRLTTSAYPGDSYAAYTPGDGKKVPNTYALCFGCHDSSMLNKDIDGSETGFHDAKLVGGKVVRQNLHWFHVVDAAGSAHKDRGRSCFVCHDPHGAPQEHNIRGAWPMSPKFSVRVEYTSKRDGGQCTRSCHDLRTYKRAE